MMGLACVPLCGSTRLAGARPRSVRPLKKICGWSSAVMGIGRDWRGSEPYARPRSAGPRPRDPGWPPDRDGGWI